jgi:hypothetical protein
VDTWQAQRSGATPMIDAEFAADPANSVAVMPRTVSGTLVADSAVASVVVISMVPARACNVCRPCKTKLANA